jgi:hypothetical protein
MSAKYSTTFGWNPARRCQRRYVADFECATGQATRPTRKDVYRSVFARLNKERADLLPQADNWKMSILSRYLR